MNFIQMLEPLCNLIKFEHFGCYNQDDKVRPTMLPVSHFDKQQEQAQLVVSAKVLFPKQQN